MNLTLEVQTVNQRAYERLCGLILSGQLAYGSRLDERVLAERLGISRTPIREAIAKLGNEGIVEYRPYQGSYVRTFSPAQVEDLFEVRKELEALAVGRATKNAVAEDFERIQDAIDRCHAALDDGNLALFEEMDQLFHQLIARLSGNQTLIDCLERLGIQIQLARHIANMAPNLPERTQEDRNQILELMRQGDGKAASRMMRRHIDQARRSVLQQIQAET